MITTHIYAHTRPGQRDHDRTEVCWCGPGLYRSRGDGGVEAQTVVHHHGLPNPSVACQVRRIPKVAAA